MSSYKVLVDSSVWVDYFKNSRPSVLGRLIEEDLICINEIIYTELAPSLIKQNEQEVLEGLQAIEKIPLRIDWEIIKRYKVLNLQEGINKVVIPDLIILQQVINEKLILFSFDNHFKLMQSHLSFELFDR